MKNAFMFLLRIGCVLMQKPFSQEQWIVTRKPHKPSKTAAIKNMQAHSLWFGRWTNSFSWICECTISLRSYTAYVNISLRFQPIVHNRLLHFMILQEWYKGFNGSFNFIFCWFNNLKTVNIIQYKVYKIYISWNQIKCSCFNVTFKRLIYEKVRFFCK